MASAEGPTLIVVCLIDQRYRSFTACPASAQPLSTSRLGSALALVRLGENDDSLKPALPTEHNGYDHGGEANSVKLY
jgi:hypothetical protein